MFETAIGRCGMPPAQFWAMTPYELSVHVAGKANGAKEQQKDLLTQAWLVAKFVWTKKLPDLPKLLKGLDGKPKRAKKNTSVEELQRIAKSKNLKGPW